MVTGIRGNLSPFTSTSLWFCLESAKQSAECLLIRIMVLPMTEVTNMSRTPDIISPTCFRLHHCIIQANRKQDVWYAFGLLVQCPFYLIRYPITGNRMLREHQQKFIMDANGLFNTRPFYHQFSCLRAQTSSAHPHFVNLHRGVQQKHDLCLSTR